MKTIRIGRRLLAAAGVIAAFGVMTLPAGAANTQQGGAGVSEAVGNGFVVTGSGQWEAANTGGATTVTFQCEVTAPGAASVTIDGCQIWPGPQNALVVPLSSPGEALATAGVGNEASGSAISVCWLVHAQGVLTAAPVYTWGCS